MALAGRRSIEIGVKRIGQFAGSRVFARNPQGRKIELLAEFCEENFPGGVLSRSTGACQRQFVDAQSEKETAGLVLGRGAVLCCHLTENDRKGFPGQADSVAAGLGM